MELTFNKVGKQYEAEFQLSADANLHIEFESAAPVKLYQRTTGSGWDLVSDVKNAVGKATDIDLTSLIYPKFVKVVCVQEPTFAAVTTSGEVTEIKSQSKEVEVTSNGTMDITPDAGFSYLNSVKVKTNVAQSGGGGGSENSMMYYSIDIKENTEVFVQCYAANMKADMGGGEIVVVGTGIVFANDVPSTNWKAAAVNVDMPTYSPTGLGIISFREQVESQGHSLDDLTDLGLTEITEAEFYNLNA
jgi:hypothetical protein